VKERKKILIVFGTRPEAIKMAPLVIELKRQTNKFVIEVCVTAQHREMLDQVLNLFEIKPDYDLNIMRAGQDLFDITSKVLLGMRDVLLKAKPDLVLVHGDTSTSTSAALSAFYNQIPVGHIEAGLRTYNFYSPWPEEMNRQVTSRIAGLHFTPTKLNKENLLNEGIAEEDIFITGNTIIDSILLVLEKMESNAEIKNEIILKLLSYGIHTDLINSWEIGKRKLILITGHRRENFGVGFSNIFMSIKELSEKYPEVDFIYPLHLNPKVRQPIAQIFNQDEGSNFPANVYLIEPLDYLPFIYLLNKSYLVLTDSGGIQEEAPGLGKPVIVMRDTTERPEAIDAGTAMLVGTNKDKIVNAVSDLIDNNKRYSEMSKAINPFGEGQACEKISYYLINHFDNH
jgi:UDP-N-acetylglucosamine 2-epimerase (non-hydrolysing)